MFIFLITAAIVVITLVIVWLSVQFNGNKKDYRESFSWLDDLKFKKK